NDIKDLIKKGLLQKIGTTQATYYIIQHSATFGNQIKISEILRTNKFCDEWNPQHPEFKKRTGYFGIILRILCCYTIL
ncbi:MAG: hypothetical protein CVT89_03625, partial [Candidatus Altiarchaeales archaeon HGW-Altiarchaeales-2]